MLDGVFIIISQIITIIIAIISFIFIQNKYEQKGGAGIEDDVFFFDPKSDEKSDWKMPEETLAFINDNIDDLKKVTNYLAGPLNIFMNEEEVKNTVQTEFDNFNKNGNILTSEEFKLVSDQYWQTKANLGRVYACKFINNLNKFGKTRFKAPSDFVIVREDKQTPIRLYITPSGSYMNINIVNCKLYLKKIKGSGVSHLYKDELKKELGYVDSGDGIAETNVILSESGGVYIVDTELKSFDENKVRNMVYTCAKDHIKKFMKKSSMDLEIYSKHYINDIDISISI